MSKRKALRTAHRAAQTMIWGFQYRRLSLELKKDLSSQDRMKVYARMGKIYTKIYLLGRRKF